MTPRWYSGTTLMAALSTRIASATTTPTAIQLFMVSPRPAVADQKRRAPTKSPRVKADILTTSPVWGACRYWPSPT
jgi:hypothetical protein